MSLAPQCTRPSRNEALRSRLAGLSYAQRLSGSVLRLHNGNIMDFTPAKLVSSSTVPQEEWCPGVYDFVIGEAGNGIIVSGVDLLARLPHTPWLQAQELNHVSLAIFVDAVDQGLSDRVLGLCMGVVLLIDVNISATAWYQHQSPEFMMASLFQKMIDRRAPKINAQTVGLQLAQVLSDANKAIDAIEAEINSLADAAAREPLAVLTASLRAKLADCK